MWIRKKEYEALKRRVAALEEKKVVSWEFGNVTVDELIRKLPSYIRKEIDRQIKEHPPQAVGPKADGDVSSDSSGTR